MKIIKIKKALSNFFKRIWSIFETFFGFLCRLERQWNNFSTWSTNIKAKTASIYFFIYVPIIQTDRLNRRSRDRFFNKKEFFARVRSLFRVWIWDQVNWSIEVVSDVNDYDLQCLPQSVFRDNSRFVLIVILLSLSSFYPPLRLRSHPRLHLWPELQADLQGAVDLQANQEWPFLFVAQSLEIVGKYRKSGPRRRNAWKKRPRLFRYIAGMIQRRTSQIDEICKSHVSLQEARNDTQLL